MSWSSVGPRLFAFYFFARIKWNIVVFICSCATCTLQCGKRNKLVEGEKSFTFFTSKGSPCSIFTYTLNSMHTLLHSLSIKIFGKNKYCWFGQLVFKGFAGFIPNLLGNMTYLHYVIPITLAWQLQKYSQVLKMFFSVIKNKNSSDYSNKNAVLVLTRGTFDPWTANKFRSTYHSNVSSLHLILRLQYLAMRLPFWNRTLQYGREVVRHT